MCQFVYSIDVLECFLFTTVSKVIDGIRHVMKVVKSTDSTRRVVIALPLYTYYSVPLNNIIKKATKMGIVVVAAAGKCLVHMCNTCTYDTKVVWLYQ